MAFVLGVSFGSFFNVCIYRIPVRRSIIRPPSHCYSCGTRIRWHDNIPLVSYLMLRGGCRYCGALFSVRYFLVELLSGIMFLAIFVSYGTGWLTVVNCAFASLLLVGAFIDADHYILPDGLTLGGLVFAVIVAAVSGSHSLIASETMTVWGIVCLDQMSRAGRFVSVPLPVYAPLLWSLAGALFGWVLLQGVGLLGRILFRKEAMGGGDIKLFAFLGAYLGAIHCLFALFVASVLGACIGLVLIIIHKLAGKDEYEEITLVPGRAAPMYWLTSIDRKSESGLGVNQSSIVDQAHLAPDSVTIRVARKTTRQMHHFPFGPYIAVAAYIVMICHDAINELLRNLFVLP
ncbi:MAG: prepilin peptidase [bacterium]|nr:prepilin peptidase [Candidatus Sumerlaeota bacterium]